MGVALRGATAFLSVRVGDETEAARLAAQLGDPTALAIVRSLERS
jgi:hypothetical protein